MCIVTDRGGCSSSNGGGASKLRLTEDPLLTSHSAFQLLKALIFSLV